MDKFLKNNKPRLSIVGGIVSVPQNNLRFSAVFNSENLFELEDKTQS